MATNYLGYAYLTKYALEYLKVSNDVRCQIGVMSSIDGVIGAPFRSIYCASKFAVNGLFESLRIEEPTIDITLICPPSIDSGFREHSYKINTEKIKIE